MTDQEVVELMRSDTPFGRARRAFNAARGRIEQASQQGRAATFYEIRRMEFDAVREIAEALGYPVKPCRDLPRPPREAGAMRKSRCASTPCHR
jgi:hypothetical protein